MSMASAGQSETGHPRSDTSRVEAFSDGVIAIAATLLVLEIRVPAVNAHLGRALLSEWPAYFAFVLSFAFIGIMWVNHHRLFNHITRTSNGLLMLNLLLLLSITAVPFPTALLADYLMTPSATAAAAVYNGTYVVVAIVFNVLWRYAVTRELVDRSTLHSAQAISRQYAVGPVAYVICFALSWASVTASLIMNTALAVYFACPPRIARAAE